MSPAPVIDAPVHVGFPRVSGDEPYLNPFVALQNSFSPRERG